MYRLNDLQRNVLITTDEVIFHAPVDHTFDRIKIQNSIIIAEERFIVPALSYEFYQALCSQKNMVVTQANLTTLQDTIFTDNVNKQQVINENTLMAETVNLQIGDIVNAAEFLSVDNLRLWKQYLWKLCAECVLLIAMPSAFVQMASIGVVHAVPTSNALNAAGNVTPSLQAVKWAMDRVMMDRIDPLIFAMQNYICKYAGVYPAYTNYCACNDKQAEESKHKRTNFVLGIYDDEDKNCGCSWDQLSGY